jgi:hypothetical protein
MIHIGTTYTPKKAKIGQKLCKKTLIPYPISFCGQHLNQSAEGGVEAWVAPSDHEPLVGRAEADLFSCTKWFDWGPPGDAANLNVS